MDEHKIVHILGESGIIVNTILVERFEDFPDAIDASIGGQIGDKIVDGVVIPKAPAPESDPQAPQRVTRRQARQALLIRVNADGIPLLDLVAPAIAAITDETQRRLAQIAWEDATEFDRYDPLVLQIGAALGLDDTGLDELFIFAATR